MAKRRFQGSWNGTWEYDPGQPLGEPGGFATVYLGRSQDGTEVAVKVISGTLPGGRRLHPKLQEREAEIAAKLRGADAAHLIHLLDVGRLGNDLLIVMELAETSLASLLTEGLLELEALAVLRDVAAGLRELHQAGIIHRDLKPSNVLRHEGVWKLADFGIARDESVGTGSPTFIGWGTPAYMAPELWEGRSPSVKTDLYALGCVAYELLTGRPPFPGPDEDSFRRQHQLEPPPTLDEALNPALRSLLTRLLSKDPADRPQDARAVEERLARIALPPSPAHEKLQRLAAEHAQERSLVSARAAEERARVEELERLRRQAASDLQEICDEALVSLQAALPDVGLTSTDVEYAFTGEDAELRIRLWQDYVSPVAGDSAVAAGEILGKNRRVRDPARLANVVFEEEAGQLRWRLYRFRASGLARTYDYGPRDRDHGLAESHFRDPRQREFMLSRPMHVWSISINQRLAPETLVDLFSEAMALSELPPPG